MNIQRRARLSPAFCRLLAGGCVILIQHRKLIGMEALSSRIRRDRRVSEANHPPLNALMRARRVSQALALTTAHRRRATLS